MHDLAFVFAGFAVGLIVGLTGVGGGSLMTPVLIFFFGVKPHLAIGTDLLFAAFTKMGGTVSMARQRLVPWRVVGLLCAGSIPAALAALWLLHRMGPATTQAQHLMTSTLGIALLLTAAATAYKVLALVMLFIGGIAAYTFVWDLGDVGIGLMTIFNIIALYPLAGEALSELKSYEESKKS